MKPHLKYLRYVLLHKLYVYAAGRLLSKLRGEYRWRLFWRLVFHDMSKFSRAEWGPYVWSFYSTKDVGAARSRIGRKVRDDRDVKYAFNVAWLHHQHVNDHHWQHWLLREDSGANIQLLPPAWAIDEMVADWIGAGSKILRHPNLAECVAETVQWYVKQYAVLQLRTQARERVERSLYLLAAHYGQPESMKAIVACQERRVTHTIIRPPMAGV